MLKQDRDTLLADEERFMSYLNDLEIHRRQQDQQMSELMETYNNHGMSELIETYNNHGMSDNVRTSRNL